MSESEDDIIQIEKMSIDQFAGSIVLILGAVGSLLLVVWQSRCGIHCRLGCTDTCYLCDCHRDPPADDITPPEPPQDLAQDNADNNEELIPNDNP
tara:strand:- start:2803 stop:3087 length:285 start_codon:yes stop_codon:yes gene_type:complete